MLEVVRGTDDLPDFLHCKDFGKFSRGSRDVVGDGYFFGRRFCKRNEIR